jgi:hypothetical protein
MAMSIAKQGFAIAWAAVLALTIANGPALAGAVEQQPTGIGAVAETLLLVETGKQRAVRPYRAIRRSRVLNRAATPLGGRYAPYAPARGGWARTHFDDQFVLDP